MQQLTEFVGNHPGLFLALAVIVGLLAWTSFRGRFQGFKAVGPIEATQLINHQDAWVLDVREDAEFRDGYILNSEHVPLSQLSSSTKRLEKRKGKPVIVGCRSGSRSAGACASLVKQGFSEVYNLKGGILAWQNANLPLVKK
jgi:rhodanese-related sulfurtransferase